LSLQNAVILLVGNKLDLVHQREVANEDIEELSSSLGIHYFETSAKENTNIKESAEYLVDAITENMSETIKNNPTFAPRGVQPRSVTENTPPEKQSSSCSC
jgi:Ras-related protein Rab-3C